jgi:hypothetical protein
MAGIRVQPLFRRKMGAPDKLRVFSGRGRKGNGRILVHIAEISAAYPDNHNSIAFRKKLWYNECNKYGK